MLSDFLLAYIECALWSTSDTDHDLESLEQFDVEDLTPECLKRMKEDCEKFQSENVELLKGLDDKQSGHDFWLTRNGHGCGFWDRNLGEVGDNLSEVCCEWGEVNLYLTDDNQIDLM